MKGLGKLLFERERLQRRTLLSDDCKYLGVAGPVTGMSLESNGGGKFSFIIPWVALSNFEVREESGGV